MTILVMKDRDTKTIFCDVVEAKGRGIEGTIERVIENISRLGYHKVIVKSDLEPALVDLVCGIIAARDEPTIPEHSPVGESQSNGIVERAVRSSKDQIRTTKLALERRINCRVPAHHPVMTWLVPHAGETISKYQVSKDGKTAYERVMGKPAEKKWWNLVSRFSSSTDPWKILKHVGPRAHGSARDGGVENTGSTPRGRSRSAEAYNVYPSKTGGTKKKLQRSWPPLGGITLRRNIGPTTNEYFLLFPRTVGLPTSRDHVNPR